MTTQFDGHTGTFLAAIATSMPKEISGDVMQGWIQDPGALKDALRQALCPPATSPKEFDVWMTVEIGGVPKEELVSLLERESFFVGDWAKDMMGKLAFTTLPQKQKLSLARCTVRDLGFTDTKSLPTFTQIKQRVKDLGGVLCPAELGPHLRQRLKDQPTGDAFLLVMEQIVGSYGYPRVFYVERDGDGKQWLRAYYARPDGQWSLDVEVVFVLASEALVA